MPLNVQAKVRMSMAGTMALNPSGKQSMHSLNVRTLRAIMYMIMIIRAREDPSDNPKEASQLAKAFIIFSPSSMPPV